MNKCYAILWEEHDVGSTVGDGLVAYVIGSKQNILNWHVLLNQFCITFYIYFVEVKHVSHSKM
jgi:hypothetical protein